MDDIIFRRRNLKGIIYNLETALKYKSIPKFCRQALIDAQNTAQIMLNKLEKLNERE